MKDETKFDFPTLRQAEIWAQMDAEATLVDQWTYHDRDSQEVFHVLGLEREEDRGKKLRLVWLVEPGMPESGYRITEPPRPWPLYRLPELSRGGQIYLCQSEASADRLRAAGLLATTSAYGAGAVHKTDFSPLAGRHTVIVPDHNEAGRLYARQSIAAMTRQSPLPEVHVLALPGLPMNGTVSDYIEMRQPRDIESIGSEIEDLAELTPEYWQARLGGDRHKSLPAPAVPTPLAKAGVLPEMRWLWPGRIPLGRLSLLLGAPDAGQSLLGADIAARVSTGAAWPDGSGSAQPGYVLFLAGAERLSDTIRPALAAADARRIITLAGLERGQAGRGPAVVAALEQAIDREPGIRLVVIDPLSAHFSGNLCFPLEALAKLASDRRLAVALIATLNGKAAGLARLRSTGGHTLAAASSAWLLLADRREADRRLLLPVKGNAGDPGSQVLACRISGGKVTWEAGPVDVQIGELLSDGRARRKPGFPAVRRRAAAGWLRMRLAGGPVGSLRGEAEAAGWSWTTVRRALLDVGAVSERCPTTGYPRWRLG